MNEAVGVRAAMILCAGLGSRLRPLTGELAKPMVPVGDVPAVAHVVQSVRLAAISRIVVNVHHRPHDVRAWAEGERISVSHERELLGTAGGVERASILLGEGAVLVWNGDILSELDPLALLEAHAQAGADAGATLAVQPGLAGEGNVGMAADGRIVRLRKESFGPEARGGEFLGVHVLSERLRDGLPPKGCLVGDVYLPSLRRGEVLRAYETSASFVDIGTVAQYLAANAAWLGSRGLLSWAHPSATVNAPIDGSVIGANAVVDAPALHSVVWPGAQVRSECNNVVVMGLSAPFEEKLP